jgi:hypothetical protein
MSSSSVSSLSSTLGFVTGLCARRSSSLCIFAGSRLGATDGRDRVVTSEDLDAFMETRLDMAVAETLESREGGRASGKAAVDGDCSLDDGTETAAGEDREVPPGLRLTEEAGPAAALLTPSLACSLTPTEALKRLYRPLRPPWTSSMPWASPAPGGAGGAVRWSKVVSVSERDAVACIWWIVVSCSAPRESLAIVGTEARRRSGTWRK